MAFELDIASEVERFASAFERANRSTNARVEDFMPPPSHPAFDEIGLELLRIDLELAWESQQQTPLDVYRQRFAEVLDSPQQLERLAFEEYRLRLQAGESVDAAAYARRYGVDVAAWPESDATSRPDSFARPSGDTTREAGSEAHIVGDAEVDVESPVVARFFPGFELLEELGRGAFARVFLARQKDLANRPVALKITRGRSVEPARLAQLQHSNIVPIHSVHQAGNLQAVCMPYLGRSTLAHVMGKSRRNGSLPRSGRELLSTIVALNDSTLAIEPRLVSGPRSPAPCFPLARSIEQLFERSNYVDAVVWIVARLADGLAHAHERGILHRDLKPANVLFSDDGRPMILDFNLSDRVDNAGAKAAAVGGTLPYMSPEHLESLLSGDALDVRSDIYSLGVLFYEFLTGELPFASPSDGSSASIAAAAATRRQSPPSVRSLNSQTPASIAAVVAKCLAPSPERRYRNAAELRDDLDLHLANRPLAHAADRAPRERVLKWARRHPRASSAAAIGFLCLTGIVCLAAGWVVRERHFGRVEARSDYRDFGVKLEEAQLPLSVPGVDADAYAEGAASGRRLLASYGILAEHPWRESAGYLNLPLAERQALDGEVLQLLQELFRAELKQALVADNPQHRSTYLKSAASYHAAVVDLARANVPDAARSMRRQQELIRRIEDRNKTLRLSELVDDASGVDAAELETFQLLRTGRYSAALPRLIRLRDESPNSLTSWLLLGVAHAGIGNAAEAEACFTTCIRLRPQYAFSYFQRGLARYQQHEYAASVLDFTKYMELQGRSPAALVNRALGRHASQDFRGALADLNAAVDGGAAQTRVYFIRAAVRRKLNDPTGARHDVQMGLALTPTDCTSWIARGIARLPHEPELALDDFRHALEADPSSRAAAQNAVHVLLDRLHRDDEALPMLDHLITSNNSDARALITRAVLYARRGDAQRAEADIAAALELDDKPLATMQAACALSQVSTVNEAYRDKALSLLARSIGTEPKLAAIALKDSDLAPLRDSAEFKQIVAAANVIAAATTPSYPQGTKKP